jgi:hypothetical protein
VPRDGQPTERVADDEVVRIGRQRFDGTPGIADDDLERVARNEP